MSAKRSPAPLLPAIKRVKAWVSGSRELRVNFRCLRTPHAFSAEIGNMAIPLLPARYSALSYGT
jgi:hypothetical protein